MFLLPLMVSEQRIPKLTDGQGGSFLYSYYTNIQY